MTTSERDEWALRIEHGNVEVGKAFGIGDRLDSGDLLSRDRETKDHQEPPPRSDYQRRLAIHERHIRSPCAGLSRSPGNRQGPAYLSWRARRHCGIVRLEDDLGIEHSKQRVEISTLGGGKKCRNQLSLLRAIWAVNFGDAVNTSAGSDRELSCRAWRTFQDSCDLAKGHGEQVVQYKGESLGGFQGVEHDEKRETDRVCKTHLSKVSAELNA